MLTRLYLENFALTDKLEISFESGMSVLSGETGAGKSIIVGAIGRLLGEKADQDDIRSGKKLAVIEGDFDISKLEKKTAQKIKTELGKNEIAFESDIISFRREIISGRASKNLINGQQVTLGQLRQVSDYLAELYGQHSFQKLLDEKNHLGFLDDFSGLTGDVQKLETLYYEWDNARKELASLLSNKEQRQKEMELLRFQYDEIKKAKIRIGEESELLDEKKILDSSQLLAEKTSNILQLLDLGDNSIMEYIGTCQKEFSRIASLDKSLDKIGELLNQASVNLEEFRTGIESYQSSIPDDPNRQEQINLRLDEIFLLKNKYGGSEKSILEYLATIEKKIGGGVSLDDQIKDFQNRSNVALKKYMDLASQISAKRMKGSAALSKKVINELSQLGMLSSKFEFEFQSEYDQNGVEWDGQKIRPTANGLETGRFLISANPGEPLKPLSKTASGGEISRIMLALKAANRQIRDLNCLLVFDEIDAGIGGETANAVAEKLDLLSKTNQLLVVTHLHQIATKSKNHYAVEKTAQKSSGRNIISVKRLNKTERTAEIKRMVALPDSVKL